MSHTFLRTILAIAVCIFGLASIAHADALFFEKAAVKTNSEATCLRFAGDVARDQGFQNVHKSQSEVAGVKNGVYVSVTCVGRGQQNAIAVVMAVAPNFGTAQQIGHLVADKVRGITCMDSPC
jgi:hypothetical protein